MRAGLALFVLMSAATGIAADPIYIDELVETPLGTLQQHFPRLRNEGCYRLADGRFLQITMDKKDEKPWRVTLSSVAPCRRPEDGPVLDVRHRSGVTLGDTTPAVIERLGRPEASAEPEADQRRLGTTEYFYICRVSEGCARHISIFTRDGGVTAISEWYSE